MVNLQPSRAIILLALGCWVNLICLLAIGYFTNPDSVGPYHVTQLVLAVVGTIGCAMWFLSLRYWRAILGIVSSLFLGLFILRFSQLVWWHPEYHPLEAIWKTIYSNASVVGYLISKGRITFGIGLLFYEWLLPLVQVIVLTALLWPSNKRMQSDRQTAARFVDR